MVPKGMIKTVLWIPMILSFTIGGANANINQKQSTSYSSPWNNNWQPNRSNPRPVAVLQKQYHRKFHKKRIRVPRTAPESVGGLVTVQTAADIPIKVAKNLANQFRGFIEDLVKDGYKPKRIGCWAPVGTHVPNSNHYHGGACDIDQTGRNKTASKMYHVSALAAKWGLRDGCSFRSPDCGHIDDGTNVGWHFRHPNLIAKYIDYQNQPIKKPKTDLSPIEE